MPLKAGSSSHSVLQVRTTVLDCELSGPLEYQLTARACVRRDLPVAPVPGRFWATEVPGWLLVLWSSTRCSRPRILPACWPSREVPGIHVFSVMCYFSFLTPCSLTKQGIQCNPQASVALLPSDIVCFSISVVSFRLFPLPIRAVQVWYLLVVKGAVFLSLLIAEPRRKTQGWY